MQRTEIGELGNILTLWAAKFLEIRAISNLKQGAQRRQAMQSLLGHTEVLTGTGESSPKDQLGALFQNKENLLPYFILLTGLSM